MLLVVMKQAIALKSNLVLIPSLHEIVFYDRPARLGGGPDACALRGARRTLGTAYLQDR